LCESRLIEKQRLSLYAPDVPDNFEKENWKELAVLAQGGDQKAYARLLNEILPFIINSLLPKVANPEWADDIAQDVLLSVHKSLNTYSADRAFRPWLNAIIHYRKTDYLRKYYSRHGHASVPVEDQISLAANVTAPEDVTEYRNVEKALQAFPEKQQKMFRMMKLEGYTAREIAEETGMTESAVKVSVFRTMEKLKETLN